MKNTIVLTIILIFGISYSSCKRYDDHKVFRVGLEVEQLGKLRNLVKEYEGADFWMISIKNKIADIFVSPNVEENFLKTLKKNEFSYAMINENIQTLIDTTKVN